MRTAANTAAAGAEIFAERESAVQSYARAFPRVFQRAQGAEIFDEEGRRYLDFLAGAGSLNYGHNHPALKRALIDHIERDGFAMSLDLHTAAKRDFLTALRDVILAPRGLDHVAQFTGPTGTNAVEAALKLARKVTGRRNVVSFTNGFHGVSLGALAVTGNQHFRRAAGVDLPAATVAPYDGYFGADVDGLAQLERMLDDPSSGVDAPAAVIVEAVQGEGGLTAASADWLRGVEALCRKIGALFIVDDIQAGCGRTGDFFSFEAAGVTPDIVTLSKSLSGYGLPFSIVLIRPELDVWAPAEHNGTFRGNNHAFVTAAAALRLFWSDGAFSEAVKRKGALVAARFAELEARFPGVVIGQRGRGMMRGLLFADPAAAAAVSARAFERGLIIERSGPRDEVVKCLAPLTISEAQLCEGLDILEASLVDVARPAAGGAGIGAAKAASASL